MELSAINLAVNEGEREFHFRADSIGDNGVIEQIFQNTDYDFTIWPQGKRLYEYHQNISQACPSLIVDAGANIGASTVWFLNTISNSFVFAIEPEENNFQLLEMNTRGYENNFNFHGAISSAGEDLILEDPGHSDWGFRTKAVSAGIAANETRVKSISPEKILADEKLRHMNPLIFKVDIEGSESELFAGNTSWMARFPLIIIELHDWLFPFSGSSRSFFKAAARCDFDFVHRGENIFLFNRELLASDH